MISRQTKKRRITSSYYNYYLKKHIGHINKLFLYSLGDYFNKSEEFSHIGLEQLLRSMIYYNSDYGSLKTYLSHRVRGITSAAVKKVKTYNMRRYVYGQNTNSFDKCVYNNDMYILLEELFKHLDNREKKVLELFAIENKLAREIAEELSIPRTTVYYLQKKAIKKLRKIFNEQETQRSNSEEKKSKTISEIK